MTKAKLKIKFNKILGGKNEFKIHIVAKKKKF